jgi:hypothetical protein
MVVVVDIVVYKISKTVVKASILPLLLLLLLSIY